MATYPSAIIVLNNPTGSTLQSDPAFLHSVQHQNENDEIEAIETELGLLPKGSYSDVTARLNDAVYKVGTQTIAGDKTFSGNLINTGGFFSPWYELGNTTAATTPYIDWHSSGTAADYDYRFIASGGSSTVGRGSMQMTGQTAVVTGTLASATPFIVDAFFGQTAPVQEWRVNGTVLSAIHADGALRVPNIVDPGGSAPYIAMNSSAVLILNRTTVSNIPFIIRGMAGQTGNLQAWQDNLGGTMASLDASGVMRVNAVAKTSNQGPYINFDTDALRLYNRTAASNIPLVITGMAAQSGPLQVWMDSTPTTLAAVYSNGSMMSRGIDSFRSAPAGGTGVIHRNDGTTYYILLTNAGDPDGTWNAFRPFQITLATGRAGIGNGLDVTGTLTVSSTISGSSLAGALLSSATPQPTGTAAVGTATIPSRQDHVHAPGSSVVLLTGAQTLTSKTLTSPAISNPSFSGSSNYLQSTGGFGYVNGVNEVIIGYAGGGGVSIAQAGPGATHTNGVVLWVSGNSLYGRHSNGADSFIS